MAASSFVDFVFRAKGMRFMAAQLQALHVLSEANNMFYSTCEA